MFLTAALLTIPPLVAPSPSPPPPPPALQIVLRGENELSLSISQEADEAIERATRWLANNPPPFAPPALAHLNRYAFAPTGEPFPLPAETWQTLEARLPPLTEAELAAARPETLALASPCKLFALQREWCLSLNAPTGWRETLALTLINTQKVTETGGHWQTPEQTLWAIITLRALLNESPFPEVEDPPPATTHNQTSE